MQSLGHQQVRGLQHALGDAERDPVDEVALPELERRRRRLLQPREVGEIAAERLPALRLRPRRRRAPPPELPLAERDHDDRPRSITAQPPSAIEHDVVPAPRSPAASGSRRRQNSDDAPRPRTATSASTSGPSPASAEPARAARLASPTLLLNAVKRCAIVVRCVLDPVAEARQPLGAAGEHAVDDRRRRSAPTPSSSLAVAGRELEVGDLLVPEPAPDLPLGRHRLRRVDAAADQVEERRGELERAGLAALAQQRRHERGLGVGRRLLLVLAVVARLPLAAAERAHDAPMHDERRQDAEQRGRSRSTRHGWCSAFSIFSWSRCERGGVGALLADDLRARPLPARRRVIPEVEVNAARGMSARSSTNWSGRHAERAQVTPSPVERHVAADPDRVPPGARDLPPGRVSVAVSRSRPTFHSSPQTFRLTSTTSS